MKLVVMAAALVLGGPAVAQTEAEDEQVQGDPLPVPGTRVRVPVRAIDSPPETDARGIPVISAPAQAPAGFNQAPRPASAATSNSIPLFDPPNRAAAGPLPPCTRTVTDRCTQTYERGRAR